MAIMGAIMNLKANEIDNIATIEGTGLLNVRQAFTLSKYLFKGFELIQGKDKQIIDMCQNGQQLLKVQIKLKEKLGNACILKS